MALSLLSTTHVNVNCSSLDRSLAFYQGLVGLVPVSHTNPVPQDGAAFGLEGRVQWDAHLLHDSRGVMGPAVDLLEWKQPAPVGAPPKQANQLGFFRLCLSHPDLDALHAKLAAAGVRTLSAPVTTSIDAGQGLAVRFFCSFDPDGACIEFLEQPGETRLLHVNVNCSSLDASSEWYQRVLGLAPLMERADPGPVDGAGLGFEGACHYRADFLAVPGVNDFIVDLLEWTDPAPVGTPNLHANGLGLFRMAWLVEDAQETCAELDRLEVAHSGACWLDMGPEIPIDGVNAIFLRDPDGACLELIELPQIQQSE
jgi:catechol 2,3-dioxygenase-like lactoylglutathione lyase family enzyme